MKNTAATVLLCLFSLLLAPVAALAETCVPAYSYTVPGTYSGSFTISMTSCSSDTGTDTSITGTYNFSNYADTAGDSINGSYDFSIVSAINGNVYEYTYGMNGGPVTYSQNQMEIYYEQFSYSARIDMSTYQSSYLNFSGGWRINGVYYPASQIYNFADFGSGTPNIDPDALGELVNPPADTTPDSFNLGSAATNVAPGSVVESATITVAGITATAPISIGGGQYSINGGAWTSGSGTVALGNQVKLRLTAPAGYGATGTATLTIGDVSASFQVSTRSFTAVTATTEVFANAGTAASVVDGVVRFTAAPTAPLQFVSGALENAVVAFDTPDAIPVLSGSATLNYTRGGSDTALQIRTIAGSPALAPISGNVTIAAPVSGSTIPVTGSTGGSATLTTGTADTSVVAGPDASRNVVVAVSSGGAVTYSATSRSRAVPASFSVYPGEAVLADEAGTAGQVRLGSFAQDGSQAGDFIANLPNAAGSLSVPLVSGASQRFNNTDWATLVGQAIASKLGLGTFVSLSQDAASGVMTLVTASGTYRFLPVGSLALADAALNGGSRAVSVAAIAANLTAILDSSLSFAVAPATAYADLKTALQNIGGSLEILGDGVLRASLQGTDYIAQPASATVEGTVTAGVCPGFDTVDNQLALCDSSGKRQLLHAAFADTDTLVSTFTAVLGSLSVSNTGADGLYSTTFSGSTFSLAPDITLSSPPADQAGKLWWVDASGKVYIRYPSGAAQGFSLQQ
jgi:hypothetical protein